MSFDKSTINLRDSATGNTLDLTVRILETNPVLSQPSIINQVSSKTGNGFTGGVVLKKSKRTQTEYSPATGGKITSGFVGASAQHVGRVMMEKKYRQDNIIFSKIDMAKLREGKGGDLVVQEVGDFILTGQELDLKEMLELAQTEADAIKLFTAKDANGAPTGAQPAQATNDTAGAIDAIKKGKRSVIVTDLDAKPENRLNILTEILAYINSIGSNKSPESIYDYSINGIPLNQVFILTNYAGARNIKDSFTTAYIDMSNATTRSYNGVVGMIDTVPVLITNQIGAKVAYHVMSKRVVGRDIDPESQYLGVMSQGDGRAVVLSDGTTVNVKPSEATIALEQGRVMGVKYFEEFFTVQEVA